jgi:hypothetical protein
MRGRRFRFFGIIGNYAYDQPISGLTAVPTAQEEAVTAAGVATDRRAMISSIASGREGVLASSIGRGTRWAFSISLSSFCWSF